jgi:hypothetical protein
VLLTELRILFVDTGRVWWRLLPMIMGVYLLGWLGSELTVRVAVIAGDVSPWLALALFAFSFVWTLVAAILILTLAGRELGIRQLLPEDEREIDDRDTSLTRLSPSRCCRSLACTPHSAKCSKPPIGWLPSSGFAVASSAISRLCSARSMTWRASILGG